MDVQCSVVGNPAPENRGLAPPQTTTRCAGDATCWPFTRVCVKGRIGALFRVAGSDSGGRSGVPLNLIALPRTVKLAFYLSLDLAMVAKVPPRARIARYALALAIVAVTTLFRLAVDPLIHDQIPFIFFVAAVVVATRLCDVGGGIVATIASGFSGHYFFVEPRRSLALHADDALGIVLFMAVGFGLVWLVGHWRNAERVLREQSEAIDRAHDAVVVHDLDNRIVSWNRGAEQLYGWTAREVVGQDPHALLQTRFPVSPEALQESLSADGEWRGDLIQTRRDGARVITESRHVMIHDEWGRPSRVLAINRDITERRRVEDRVRALSRAVEQSPVSVVITDVEGNIEYVNPMFTRLTGYSFEEALGKNPRILKSGETPAAGHQRLWDAITAGREWHGEFHNKKKNGELYWEQASVSAITDESGIVHFLAVKEDITERKRIEEALRGTARELSEADRLKDEFIAIVSHELRTPLNAVLGWAEMLRTKRLDHAVQERAVQAISENARRQAQLMDDLLDISRIVAGKVTMEPALIEPGAVVRRAVDTVAPAATAKGIALDVSIGRTLRGVFADPARLQQVVWNLLSNAVKFTPNGGRVSVSVEATDEEVEIVVADNGIGIPPAFLPHAFDWFRQADSRPTRSYGGLGLGLSIVRHLVEAQGGTVRAESEGEGRGATFVVSLPAREFYEHRHEEVAETGSRTSVSIVPVRPDNPPSLRRVRVLIVDDDADTRELMAAVLGRHGATVGQAASAVEALEKLACIGADVLLIDLAMPDVDGYTLIGLALCVRWVRCGVEL